MRILRGGSLTVGCHGECTSMVKSLNNMAKYEAFDIVPVTMHYDNSIKVF